MLPAGSLAPGVCDRPSPASRRISRNRPWRRIHPLQPAVIPNEPLLKILNSRSTTVSVSQSAQCAACVARAVERQERKWKRSWRSPVEGMIFDLRFGSGEPRRTAFFDCEGKRLATAERKTKEQPGNRKSQMTNAPLTPRSSPAGLRPPTSIRRLWRSSR